MTAKAQVVTVTATRDTAIVRKGATVTVPASPRIDRLIAAGYLIELGRTKPPARRRKPKATSPGEEADDSEH